MSDDPGRSLVVVGGRSVSRVDADDVRAAALWLTDAATALRNAAGSCLAARAALDRAVWAPVLGDTDPARVGRLQWARSLSADGADLLGARARQCASLADRLLIAAGLYRHAETVVEQVLDVLVADAVSRVSHAVTRVVADPVLGLPWRFAGRVLIGQMVTTDDAEAGAPAETAVPAAPDMSTETVTIGLTHAALRRYAPLADEVVLGAGVGTSLGAPGVSGEVSVTGGARVLSTFVDGALPESDVEIEEVAPEEFTNGPPAWSDRPAGQVAEAVAMAGDLYAHGSGIDGREVPGAPPGTVAVQKITDADGSVSWLVVIPGTQELLSATNPFDADTDLDLMAREKADVMVGVEQAMTAAGVGPDEPVVIVGHSLGGIAAVSLAGRPAFTDRFRLRGIVTAGSPTATMPTPRGVPVLHLENTEELVSSLDGASSEENPATSDRVTVGRRLADSNLPTDVIASTSVSVAHGLSTHLRTLHLAKNTVQVTGVTRRIDPLLDGERAETRFYRIRRAQREAG